MGKRLDAWKRLIFKTVKKTSNQKETELSPKEEAEESLEDETEKEEKEAKETAEKEDKEKAAENQAEKKDKAKEADVEAGKEDIEKEAEDEAEKDEKEKEAEDKAEKEDKEKEAENEAEKDEKEKKAENEAEKEDKEKEAENEAEKEDKEKEAESEAEKDDKEKEEKENEEKEKEKESEDKEKKEKEAEKEDEKEAGKGEAEKDKDDKQKLRDGRKLKKDLDSLKAGAKEKGSGKDQGHGRAADKAERALTGEVLKHMLEYEQLNETPGNRILNELVGYGKTDELVKVISATDQFQASHKKSNQKNDAKQKSQPAPAAEQQGLQPVSAVQTAQYLTEALRMAREHEKNKKREAEQKERLGYKDLLAMEDSAHGRKPKEQRIVRRPVKELKLADSAEAGKAQTQNLEPPAMGPKLPSRRKRPNQDPNQQ